MYKIVGADQREYGPVTSEQVREWLAQGRANGQTIASFEGSPWKPLSTYPEFADALRANVPPPVGQPATFSAPVGLPGAKTNTAAVAGLVFSIVGSSCCCVPVPILPLLGLILCVVGLIQIQNSPQLYTTNKIIPIVGIVIALIEFVLIGTAAATGVYHQALRNFPR